MAGDPRFFRTAGARTVAAILDAVGGACAGDHALRLTGIAALDAAGPADLTYCEGRKHREALRATRAGVVIVAPPLAADVPDGSLAIVTPQPALAFARAARLFHPPPTPAEGWHPTAVIGADAVIGAGCALGPYAVIGAGATLGEGCVLHPHAVVGPHVVLGAGCVLHPHASITHAIAGDGVVLHPGARVGQEGFGLVPTPDGFETMPQLGLVRLGDRVEVGANSCIDRGAMTDTVIGPGTRIDNLVQVAHGVTTGKGCILIAQAGIAGSATVGDRVVLAAQAGIMGHLRVGDGARIGAQAGVLDDIPAGQDVIGSPAWPARETWRAVSALRRLGRSDKAG